MDGFPLGFGGIRWNPIDRWESIRSHLLNPLFLPRALIATATLLATTTRLDGMGWDGMGEIVGEKLKKTPLPHPYSATLPNLGTKPRRASKQIVFLFVHHFITESSDILFRYRTCLPVGPGVDWATRSTLKQFWVHRELSRTNQHCSVLAKLYS
jgi:hypothetical protein